MKPKNHFIAMLCGIFFILTGSGWPQQQTDSLAGQRPMTTSEKIKAQRLKIQLQGDPVEAAVSLANQRFRNTDCEARVENVQKDILHFTHIRMNQYYKGVLVGDAGIIVHVNGGNVVYQIDGDMLDGVNVSVVTKLNASVAEGKAVENAMAQPGYSINAVITCVEKPTLFIYGGKLIYRLALREDDTGDSKNWGYWVDATSGDVLRRGCLDAYFNPPSDSGYNASVSGIFLANEVNPGIRDSDVTVTGWKDTAGTQDHYYLYYKGNPANKLGPWGVFDLHGHATPTPSDTLCDWERSLFSNWGTTDRASVSLAMNLDRIQRWIGDSLGLYSINGAGCRLKGYSHMGSAGGHTCYSYTDTAVCMRDNDNNWYPSAVLDVVSHETNHGLTYLSTGGLCHSGERGGLTESYGDIFGCITERFYQPDSSSLYPYAGRGCFDWLVGEDWAISYTAVRDMRQPHRIRMGGLLSDIHDICATYYEGPDFWQMIGWEWAPHYMSGVQNFAYYLLSEGSPSLDTNVSHSFGPFSGLGFWSAAKIVTHANLHYMTKYSSFTDSRNAWLYAAQDLIDSGLIPSNSVNIAESAWVAVGVKPEIRISYGASTKAQLGYSGNLKLTNLLDSNVSLSGLSFKHISSGNGLSIDSATNFNFRCSNLPSRNDSLFLDTVTNLKGGLIVKRPDGINSLYIDTIGRMKIRKTVIIHAISNDL